LKTILLVDDESAILDALRAVLEDAGYGVVTAGNGAEGLMRLREAHPDLVLTDTMMPVLDGVGLVRQIKAEPDYRSIPVIMMSAARWALPKEDQSKVATFFQKPFDLDALLATIGKLIGRGDASAADAGNGRWQTGE
jgi:CheY-like chemotaxis protein